MRQEMHCLAVLAAWAAGGALAAGGLTDVDRQYIALKSRNAKIPTLDAERMEVGQLGRIEAVQITQVVDETTVMCRTSEEGPRFFLGGINTDGLIDDKIIVIKWYVLAVTGTRSYRNVLGAKRTVFRVDVYTPSMEVEQAVAAELKRRIEEAAFRAEADRLGRLRTWTDRSGRFQVRAEYVEYSDGKVVLRKEDKKEIVVSFPQLSQKDQEFVRGKRTPALAK